MQVANKDKQLEGANHASSEERTRLLADKEEMMKQKQTISEQHRATVEEGRVSKHTGWEGSVSTLDHC